MLLAVRYAEEALEYAWAAAKELPFRKPFLRLTSCGPSDTARRKTLGSDPPRPHWTKTTPHRYQRCESHIPPSYFFFVVRRHRKGTTSGAIRPGRAACKTDEPDYRASVCFTSSHARQECAWIVGVSRFPWHGVVKGAKRNTSRRTTASPAKHLLGGTHHEVPCPHGCRQSLRRKEFASPLGVRVCESLHEKQDRK